MKTKPGLFSLLAKLGKDKRARGRRLLARLIRDEAGSYLIYMGFTLPVLIGVAGLAGEASLLLYNNRTLQGAADAAAYSTAVAYSLNYPNMTVAQLMPQAQAIVASYGFTGNQAFGSTCTGASNVACVGVTKTTFSGLPAISVTVSRPQSSIFSSFWPFTSLPAGGNAIAVIHGTTTGSGAGGNCVLALGNTASSPPANAADALQIQGGGGVININAPNCGIFSNSNDCTSGSVAFGGNAKVIAGALGAAGCVSTNGNPTITLPAGATYTQNDGAITDPWSGLPNCSGSSPTAHCIPTSTSPSPSSGCTPTASSLCPGVYPNGISVTGGGTVTLNPGIYILDCSKSTCPKQGNTTAMVLVKKGTLTDGTTSSTPGAGVTLVFTCSTCQTASQWPSNGILVASLGNLNLSAPASATSDPATAGFVMMEGPGMPLDTAFDNHANPTSILNGTIWVPNGAFSWGGTPSTGGGTTCLEMIVNTMQFYGNSGFSSNGCLLSAGGGSGGAGKPIGSSQVTLVD